MVTVQQEINNKKTSNSLTKEDYILLNRIKKGDYDESLTVDSIISLLKRSSEENKDAEASYFLGMWYWRIKDNTHHETLADWKSNFSTTPPTMNSKCHRYYKPDDWNHQQSFNWLLTAAAQGHGPSQYQVAQIYQGSMKYTCDTTLSALFWYKKAATEHPTNPLPHAKFKYASMVLLSLEEETDNNPENYSYKMAFEQLWQAADLTDPSTHPNQTLCTTKTYQESTYRIAKCYFNGYGVIPSREESLKWLSISSDNGCKEAYSSICKVYSIVR
jgi:TPR repeat protein